MNPGRMIIWVLIEIDVADNRSKSLSTLKFPLFKEKMLQQKSVWAKRNMCLRLIPFVSDGTKTETFPIVHFVPAQPGNVQTNRWINACASVVSDYIWVEGVRGDDYGGDIAIDDVVLSRGSCPSSCASPNTPPVRTFTSLFPNVIFSWSSRQQRTSMLNNYAKISIQITWCRDFLVRSSDKSFYNACADKTWKANSGAQGKEKLLKKPSRVKIFWRKASSSHLKNIKKAFVGKFHATHGRCSTWFCNTDMYWMPISQGTFQCLFPLKKALRVFYSQWVGT